MKFMVYAELEGFIAVLSEVYVDRHITRWQVFFAESPENVVEKYGEKFNTKQLNNILGFLPVDWEIHVFAKVISNDCGEVA